MNYYLIKCINELKENLNELYICWALIWTGSTVLNELVFTV